MKLSETEEKILGTMAKNESREFSLDMLSKVVYGAKKKPEHWRTALAATMRLLAIKTEKEPFAVYRSSPLGRGNIATYRIRKLEKKKARHSAKPKR